MSPSILTRPPPALLMFIDEPAPRAATAQETELSPTRIAAPRLRFTVPPEAAETPSAPPPFISARRPPSIFTEPFLLAYTQTAPSPSADAATSLLILTAPPPATTAKEFFPLMAAFTLPSELMVPSVMARRPYVASPLILTLTLPFAVTVPLFSANTAAALSPFALLTAVSPRRLSFPILHQRELAPFPLVVESRFPPTFTMPSVPVT